MKPPCHGPFDRHSSVPAQITDLRKLLLAGHQDSMSIRQECRFVREDLGQKLPTEIAPMFAEFEQGSQWKNEAHDLAPGVPAA
jgi:hypothetical protein